MVAVRAEETHLLLHPDNLQYYQCKTLVANISQASVHKRVSNGVRWRLDR